MLSSWHLSSNIKPISVFLLPKTSAINCPRYILALPCVLKADKSTLIIFRLHNSVIWYFIINVCVCVCYCGDLCLNCHPWTHVFKCLVSIWYCYGGLWNFEDGVEQLEDIYHWGRALRLHNHATVSIWAFCFQYATEMWCLSFLLLPPRSHSMTDI